MSKQIFLSFLLILILFCVIILRKHFGGAEEINVRSKNLENIPHLNSSKVSLEKRLKNFDLEVSPPVEILRSTAAYFRSFPILEPSVLIQASSER